MSPTEFDRAAQAAARRLSKVPTAAFRCKLSEATTKARAAKASLLRHYDLNANQF